MTQSNSWQARFDRFLEPFLEQWRYKKRRKWAPVYLKGLLLPGERKSIEPLAERVAPGERQQLHHFVCNAEWDLSRLEEVLWNQAEQILSGHPSVLIIDDTALPKKGDRSVGVAPQYCGALGKKANCQSLVTLTLSSDDVPIPLVLRLYLPECWIEDGERRAETGIPEHLGFRPKWRIALDELRRLIDSGTPFDTVLADAGYGVCSEFRDELTRLGLTWAVGITSSQRAYRTDVITHTTELAAVRGRPRKHPVISQPVSNVADIIDALGPKAFRSIAWRKGVKGPLKGKFAACRVRLGDGGRISKGDVLPGNEVWLVCEQRSNERKYYVTSHPHDCPTIELIRSIKARWSCEQAHQQLKEELGLDHFEGRSWLGLHQHAFMTQLAFTFLQKERLREKKQAA